MNDSPETELNSSTEDEETQNRRNFLQSMGKWSGAAISLPSPEVGSAVAPKAEPPSGSTVAAAG